MKNLFLLIAVFFNINGVSQSGISHNFKKAVAFIFALNDSGAIVPYGTGFYVSVNQNETKSAGYIVTAKHVLKNQNGNYLDKIFVRVSQISDSALVIIPITLHNSGAAKNIYTHSDTTVDIAVISETPRQDKFDYLFLPSSFITTRKDFDLLNIQEGDEVFFTGMFTQYLGEKANYPITRFGKVSLVTNEKVLWNGNYRNLYLLETTTYWGNSGSPVYFSLQRKPDPIPNGIVIGSKTVIKLAGIMNGFFGQNVPGGFFETKVFPYSLVNFGISAVTPAYLLWDILYSEELKKNRGF